MSALEGVHDSIVASRSAVAVLLLLLLLLGLVKGKYEVVSTNPREMRPDMFPALKFDGRGVETGYRAKFFVRIRVSVAK